MHKRNSIYRKDLTDSGFTKKETNIYRMYAK